jgi:hypothetical protein
MPILDRLRADTKPHVWIEEKREPGSARWIMAASDNRTFAVPQPVFKSLQKAGITPPPVGQKYSISDLDQKFRDAGLDLGERISAKTVLERLGLL